jgi:Domain of Unknown Function (DUF1206)
MVAHSARRRMVTRRQAQGRPRPRWLTGLARAGFVARGIQYALIGIIAIEIALGSGHQQADRSGAVRLAAQTPFGAALLWLLAIGFAGMALWRLSEVIWGGPGPDGRKLTTRLGDAGRTILYAAFAYGVLKYALGLGAPASTDKQTRDLTASAMHYPAGPALVTIAGLVIIGAGAAIAWSAVRRRFLRQLNLGSASPGVRSAVERLGQIGGVARGVVFAAVGVFLVTAGVSRQPDRAKGLDSALRAFASTSAGPWLLVVVAFGLITFGAFSCCEARYRRT